jgi:hypothetical protein
MRSWDVAFAAVGNYQGLVEAAPPYFRTGDPGMSSPHHASLMQPRVTRLHSESPRCILYHSLETFRAVYLFSYKFINRNHPKRRKIQRPQGPLSTPAPLLRTNSAPSLLRHYTFILTRPHSALPILRHLHIYRHLPIPRILRPPQTMTT